MELHLQIKMNDALYVRDPEASELGKNIVSHGISMISSVGFEDFTFKKLAADVGTTEASIYRYFENKHRLLTYLTAWFWTWMEYQLVFHTNNLSAPSEKIRKIIALLTFQEKDKYMLEHIDKNLLHQIVISEGNKAYFTKHVTEDNKAMIFKPYKDLCHRMAQVFLEYNPRYKFPHSLASTLIETAHHQIYFSQYLPRLTDYSKNECMDQLVCFLSELVFNNLEKKK